MRLPAFVFLGLSIVLACSSQGGSGDGPGPGSGASTGSGATTGAGASGGASFAGASGSVAAGGAITGGGTPGAGGSIIAGGTPGAGGSVIVGGGSGGSGAESACGTTGGYAGPALGRCDSTWCDDGTCSVPGAGTVVASGGFLTLDDFQGVPAVVTSSATSIPLGWPSRDGRIGSWALYAHAAGGAQLATAAAEGGGSPGSTQALHFTGLGSAAADFYPSTAALPISNCYDASAYDGISLWLKGNPAAGHSQIKLNLHTPPTEPKVSWDLKKGSGVCEAGCYDHFAVTLDVTSTWTRYKIPWASFKRLACTATTPPVPDGFEPQKQLLQISFSQMDPLAGFDVWVDDITFDIDTRPADDFDDIVTQAVFNEMFKTPAAGMDHATLIQAMNAYGNSLAKVGEPLANKHEAAAFLAQIAHETGSLTLIEENCADADGCTTNDGYHGRGVIQLTHSYNYQAAQDAGFAGIVANPDLVLTNKVFAFGVGIWFWNTYQSSKGICHDEILAQDFGGTTNIINGIECGGSLQDSRVQLYQQFCAALGINIRGTLKC